MTLNITKEEANYTEQTLFEILCQHYDLMNKIRKEYEVENSDIDITKLWQYAEQKRIVDNVDAVLVKLREAIKIEENKTA